MRQQSVFFDEKYSGINLQYKLQKLQKHKLQNTINQYCNQGCELACICNEVYSFDLIAKMAEW